MKIEVNKNQLKELTIEMLECGAMILCPGDLFDDAPVAILGCIEHGDDCEKCWAAYWRDMG